MNAPIHRRMQFSIIVLMSILIPIPSAVADIDATSGTNRGYGLGDMGTAVVDHRSYMVNPASLALYAPRWDVAVTVGPYMRVDNESLGISLRAAGAAVSFGRDRFMSSSKFCFGAAYWYQRYDYGTFTYTDAASYVVQELEWNNTSHNVSLSIGYDGSARVGLGTNLRMIKENNHSIGAGYSMGQNSASTFALDLGLQLSIPFRLDGSSGHVPMRTGITIVPTLGVTVKNLMGEFEFESQTQELPREYRTSLGIQFLQEDHGFDQVALLAVFERERVTGPFHDLENVHLMSQLTLLEILSVSYGCIDLGNSPAVQTSYGIGFSSQGLAEYIGGEQQQSGELPKKNFFSKVSLEVLYGKYIISDFIYYSGVAYLDVALVITL